MEEDYVYKPEELIFAIFPGNIDFEQPDSVIFTTKESWKNEKCCSDDLGGYNMPQEILKKCGVEPEEFVESAFEITGEFDLETVKQKLITEGFEYCTDFDNFLKDNFQE